MIYHGFIKRSAKTSGAIAPAGCVPMQQRQAASAAVVLRSAALAGRRSFRSCPPQDVRIADLPGLV